MPHFYLDADVSVHVAPLLAAQGHSATTAMATGKATAGDDEQIEVVTERGWILVTHNRKHFRLLHDAWRRFARMWHVEARHPES